MVEIIPLLLEAGANASINLQNIDGNTSLMFACKSFARQPFASLRTALESQDIGPMDVLPLLLKAGAGASINLQNKDGNTALILACSGRLVETIPLLLESGAGSSIDLKNKNGDTALIAACSNEEMGETIPLLLAAAQTAGKDIKVNAQNAYGNTALIVVAKAP